MPYRLACAPAFNKNSPRKAKPKMTLYLHPDSKGTLASAYEDAFQSAQEIFVLSAFLFR